MPYPPATDDTPQARIMLTDPSYFVPNKLDIWVVILLMEVVTCPHQDLG